VKSKREFFEFMKVTASLQTDFSRPSDFTSSRLHQGSLLRLYGTSAIWAHNVWDCRTIQHLTGVLGSL